MVDNKKLAAKRLQELKARQRKIRLLKADLYEEIKKDLVIAIHAKCLLSLNDERVVQAIDEVAHSVAKKIGRRLE